MSKAESGYLPARELRPAHKVRSLDGQVLEIIAVSEGVELQGGGGKRVVKVESDGEGLFSIIEENTLCRIV